jgi:rSAM/selenodomain-associated transferase 1
MNKSALLVFTRAPVPGQTKTRLIPLLGAQGAADFHQSVLQLTLAESSASDFRTVEIWCATEIDHPFLKQCELNYACAMKIQQGDDLGERMHYATETTLAENTFVVIIGSDCPAITTDILNQAHQHLSNGKDAVLGTAKDGGYYLIGLSVSNPEIFQDITWGEGNVAERTCQNFADLGLDYVELEELPDIDTPGDYQRYIRNP